MDVAGGRVKAAPHRTRGPLGGRRGCDACGGHIRDGVCEGCGRDLRVELAERRRRDTIALCGSVGGFLTLAAIGLWAAYGLDGLLKLTEGGGSFTVGVWAPFVLGPLLLVRALGALTRRF